VSGSHHLPRLIVVVVLLSATMVAPSTWAASARVGLTITIVPSPEKALTAAAEGRVPVSEAVGQACRQILATREGRSLGRQSADEIVGLARRSGVVLVGDTALVLGADGARIQSLSAAASSGASDLPCVSGEPGEAAPSGRLVQYVSL
jgi:hypothetical protein